MTQSSLSTNETVPKQEQKQTKKQNKKQRKKRTTGNHSLLRHTLSSYWWLAFACGVVYFFAGPVFTLLYLNGMNFDATHYTFPMDLHQQNIEQIARWMSAEGMLPLYLSAVVLSMILGCVMFAYLQHRRQVNFYHSQPIHRTRLFINQYGVGFVMNMVLMLVMLAVSMLMVVMYGLGEGLAFGGIVRHVVNIFVLSLASYSISVLAGQLTGTVLTHLALMLVMHFGIPLATVVIAYMGEIFFATFNFEFPMVMLNFSPLCAMIALLADYSTRYLVYMTAPAMSTSMLVILLIIGIGFAVLAWALYQKRPSEATGKSLIYPITEPIVKAYLMFVGALGGGFIFYAVGDKAFFYFGIVVFAVLIHMVCQVIIEHDFKALFRKLNHCAVIVVMICAVVGIARFDLLGYDHYLPHPDKVSAVSFQINNIDDYYASPVKTSDPAVKQQVYDLLKPVIGEELYRSSQFDGYQRVLPADIKVTSDTVKYININVTYELNSGREVTRQYRDVALGAVQENFAELYNNQAYRESYYGEVLQAPFDKVTYLYIDNYTLYNPNINDVREKVAVEYSNAVVYSETVPYPVYDKEMAVLYEIVDSAAVTLPSGKNTMMPDEYSPEAAQLAKALYQAYQKDLLDRDFHTLEQVIEKNISIQILKEGSMTSSRGYSTMHYNLPVYASDKRTMAILEQYNLHKAVADYSYNVALIVRCDETTEADMRDVLNNIGKYNEIGILTEQELLDGIAANNAGVVVGRIEGKDAINAFITETKLRNGAAIFRTFDTTHYVLMQYPYDVDGTDAKEWRVELFYSDTVPVRYQ